MMMSGLVVKLASDSLDGSSALPAIRAAAPLTVGDQDGCWLSVALETPDAIESERWHDWLQNLPGVESVEVVFVHWDETDMEVAHEYA